MSKKLIVIVVGLFILQFGLFTLIEMEVKPEEKMRRLSQTFNKKFDIYLDNFGQPYNEKVTLSHKNLSEIPEQVYNFKKVTTIDLTGNNLTEFPYKLLNLPNLKSIILDKNQITTIDFSMIENSLIESLSLQNNQITEIKKLENLNLLVSINLSSNELTTIPNTISEALNYAYFTNNKITKLEGKIGRNLISLQLNNNLIKDFEFEFSGDEILSELNLSKNYTLKQFPYKTFYLQGLTVLNLADCDISSMSERPIIANENLDHLDLKNNQLVSFTTNDMEFNNLKSLDLSNNSLQKVSITNHSIETLSLENNLLQQKKLFLKMNNLTELLLTDNNLTALSNTSIDAPNLTYLNIFNNKIPTNNENKILRRLIKQ